MTKQKTNFKDTDEVLKMLSSAGDSGPAELYRQMETSDWLDGTVVEVNEAKKLTFTFPMAGIVAVFTSKLYTGPRTELTVKPLGD